MSEAQMVKMVEKRLLAKEKRVYVEVPFLSRCIDMVIINQNEIISIEFKIGNWKKAIKQAKDHSLGADKAYICLPPRKKISDELREELAKNGIGLYFYRETEYPLEEIIPAGSSKLKWDVPGQWLLDALQTR